MLKGFPKATSRFKDFQEDKEGFTGLSVESAHGYDLLQQENKKQNQQREKKHGAEDTFPQLQRTYLTPADWQGQIRRKCRQFKRKLFSKQIVISGRINKNTCYFWEILRGSYPFEWFNFFASACYFYNYKNMVTETYVATELFSVPILKTG